MIGAVNWDSLSVGGAFVVGAVLATIATLRIFRIAASYLTRIEQENKKDDLDR